MAGAFWFRLGAILGGFAVITGAFGAHGLESYLEPEDLETWEIAVRYHMYHALALLSLGLFVRYRNAKSTTLKIAGSLLMLGTLLFSGGLYAYVLAGGMATWTGIILAPTGGVILIVGWFTMAVGATVSAAPHEASIAQESERVAQERLVKTTASR